MTYTIYGYFAHNRVQLTRKTRGGALHACKSLHKLGWIAFYQEA